MLRVNSITLQEAEERWLSKWEEVPMAQLLVNLFREYSNTAHLIHLNSPHGNPYADLFAPVIGQEKTFLLRINCFVNNKGEDCRVDLHLCRGDLLSGISYLEKDDDWFDRWIWFVADEHEAGTWAYGRGNLMTHAIRVHVKYDFVLPSAEAQWAFEFLAKAAMRAREFALDVDEQPHFWSNER